MQNKTHMGMALTILGAALFSLNAILLKTITVDGLLLSALRGAIGGLVLLPFLRIRKINWNLNTLLLFIAFTGQCTLIIFSVRMTSTPVAIGIQFTSPIWLYLAERKKGEPFSLSRTWPLIALLAGIILFMFSKGEGVTMLGNLIALCTSFTHAAMTYFSKRVVGDCPIGTASLCCLFLSAVIFLFMIPAPVQAVMSVPASAWPMILVLGIVQFGGGYAFYYMGVRHISSKTAGMLAPIEMVLAPTWVALFLNEWTDTVGLIGFVIVIIGVIGEVMVVSKESKEITAQ
ncbi:MAG: DMT family transporter [Clostridia bacterium]|nr:DMT family transporter [Clostridia bacterium]